MMPQPPFFNPGNQPIFGGFMNPLYNSISREDTPTPLTIHNTEDS